MTDLVTIEEKRKVIEKCLKASKDLKQRSIDYIYNKVHDYVGDDSSDEEDNTAFGSCKNAHNTSVYLIFGAKYLKQLIAEDDTNISTADKLINLLKALIYIGLGNYIRIQDHLNDCK